MAKGNNIRWLKQSNSVPTSEEIQQDDMNQSNRHLWENSPPVIVAERGKRMPITIKVFHQCAKPKVCCTDAILRNDDASLWPQGCGPSFL